MFKIKLELKFHCITLRSNSVTDRSQGRHLEAGTEAEAIHRGTLLTALLFMAWSVCFLLSPRTTFPLWDGHTHTHTHNLTRTELNVY